MFVPHHLLACISQLNNISIHRLHLNENKILTSYTCMHVDVHICRMINFINLKNRSLNHSMSPIDDQNK